jgi:hypothetical protein
MEVVKCLMSFVNYVEGWSVILGPIWTRLREY